MNRSLNTLIALGTGVAHAFSVGATVAPRLLPQTMRQHGIATVYFDPAAFIVSLVLFGQVLELRARARTAQAPSVAPSMSMRL